MPRNHYKYDRTMKEKFQLLMQHFVRGLLFVFPVGATIIIVVGLVTWMDNFLNNLLDDIFGISLPGLGIIIVFLGIALFGYLLSNTFIKALFKILDRYIERMPFVSIIYTSLKELTEAFVGDKKKFTHPVLVKMTDAGLHRLGFVTREEFGSLDLKGLVAVYCPHSYNFSGNLFFIPKEQVTPIDANPTDVMKFIISAGVTNIRTGSEASAQNQGDVQNPANPDKTKT